VDPGPMDPIEERNAAIVQRLVRAFDDGSVPMIVLEVLSPHVTVEPFLGHATGASIAVEADLTYRLDTNGLVVELWQHALAGFGRP